MGQYHIVYLGVFVRGRRGVLVYGDRGCVDGGDLSCNCTDGGGGDDGRGGIEWLE